MRVLKDLSTPLLVLLFLVATTIANVCLENECRFTLAWSQQQLQQQQQQQQQYDKWNFLIIDDRDKITKLTFEPMITTRLPTNILEAFKDLTTFDASHQNISNMDARVFGGNATEQMLSQKPSSVETIDLSSNNIPLIPKNAFTKVPNLEMLDLSQNNIREIKNEAFWKLGNLKNLKLNNNKLTSISDTTFKHLHTVQHIDLSNNLLQTVNLDDIALTSSLVSISLRNNNITRVNANELGQSLESIDLSKNNIESITGNASFGTLNTLNLASNPRLKLDKEDFERMTNLVNLYLLDTDVEIFDLASIPEFPILESLSLKEINVNNTNSVKLKFPKLQSLVTTDKIWNCSNHMDLLNCDDLSRFSADYEMDTHSEQSIEDASLGDQKPEEPEKGKSLTIFMLYVMYVILILLLVVAPDFMRFYIILSD